VILSRRPASRDEFFSLREEARKADPRAFEDSLPTAKMNRHTTASCSDHERSLFVGHQCCQLRHHEKEPCFRSPSRQSAHAGDRRSTVTEAALRYGLARHPSPALEATIDTFLLAVTVFPWDSEAARHYGDLRAGLERLGQPLGSMDMMIAAHALSLGLTLISSDVAFKRIKHLKVEGRSKYWPLQWHSGPARLVCGWLWAQAADRFCG